MRRSWRDEIRWFSARSGRHGITLLLVVGQLSAAQSPTQSAAAATFARRLAGCYRLDDGGWRADSVGVGDVSTRNTPLVFELTARLLQGWNALQSSDRPMFVVRDPSRSFTYWQRNSGSRVTIRVSRPLPMAGVQLSLTPQGRDLAGSVTAFTDALEVDKPSEITRPVYARRVACPAQGVGNGRSKTVP